MKFLTVTGNISGTGTTADVMHCKGKVEDFMLTIRVLLVALK